MTVSAPWRARLKTGFFVLIGILTVSMVLLSLVELWVINTADNVTAYGAVEADGKGLPPADQRGAFLVLNEQHNPAYAGNLVELLATTEPGVVDTTAGAHLKPAELKSVLIQSAILGEGSEYRVYRIGVPDEQPMKTARQPGGKLLYITPADGVWRPGSYLVDIPSEGMFGGRTYFQFYIDQ
ncbi:MAG: hypothetical protein ACJ78Q_08405 [Chloroflexia bacterium]